MSLNPPGPAAGLGPAARRLAWQDLGAAAAVILLAQLAAAPLAWWWFEGSFGPIDLTVLVAVTHGAMLVGTLAILRRRGATLAILTGRQQPQVVADHRELDREALPRR